VQHVKEMKKIYETYKKMILSIGKNLFSLMNPSLTYMPQMAIEKFGV
jgi:hypothetical protein